MSKTPRGKKSVDERQDLARQLRVLRQGRGMTQAEVARLAGVSRATVINLESGATVPQHEKLASILAVLGVETDEPQFAEQTQSWLMMLGTLIEAIPEPRRQASVDGAVRALAAGLRSTDDDTLAPVSAIGGRDVSALSDDELHALPHAAYSGNPHDEDGEPETP